MSYPSGMWPALYCVADERARQESLKAAGKFKLSCADAEMADCEFVAVLGEEFGEVAHEINETIGRPEKRNLERLQKMHAECIQVAAVAVARAELYQREIDALKEQEQADREARERRADALDMLLSQVPIGTAAFIEANARRPGDFSNPDIVADEAPPSSQEPWRPDPMAV